jgi:hypothetical protein
MSAEIRKQAAIWLVLVFVLGAATGGVFGYSFAHRSFAADKLPVMTDAERRAKKVAEMTEEIGLTAEQAQKAAGIIGNAQTEIHGLHLKNDAEMDAVRMKARAQMREFLTPEQMPKYEAYVQRLDAEKKRQKEAQTLK